MRCGWFCQNLCRSLFVVVLIVFPGTLDQAFAQYRSTFPMPKVVGLTVGQAQERVLSAGRSAGATSAKANVTSRPNAAAAGRIIQQLNTAGAPMRPYMDDVGGNYGEVVFGVVVSSGPELAPDFRGELIEVARQHASRKKVILKEGSPRNDPRMPPGRVVDQSPEPGQPMTRRRVTVHASAGYPLPNYLNRSIEDARLDSLKLGFRLEQQRENKLDVPLNMIFEQSPRAGSLLPLREPVTLTVSRGWPVPEFIGKNELDADKIARENRVRLSKAERDNFEVPVGVIFSQQPIAGEPLPSGRTVKVAVSRGYPLPDLTGKHERDARRLASELKFELDIKRTPIVDRRVGLVHRQRPAPNTLLPFDERVSIEISKGWPTPHFLTLEESEAKLLAAEMQVEIAVVRRREDRAAQPGIVISQKPLPATLLPPGQAVEVVISAGYPTPGFVGLTEDNAMSLAAQDRIILDKTTKPNLEIATGVVSQQFPGPGAPLPADDTVSITISSGWPTPDFVGISEEDANDLARESSIELVGITPAEHFDLVAGLVIEQQPPAGAVIPTDRRVRISLSLGWPVAPAAVGSLAGSVRNEFLARHPKATVDASESILTLKPAGTVISQQPSANIKLDRQRRLKLVSSGVKPFWFWPVIGLGAFAAALGGVKLAKNSANSTSGQQSARTDDMGGIRLRVTKDHGMQTTSQQSDDETGGEEIREIVKVRVSVDLGEQSAGPVDDKGD